MRVHYNQQALRRVFKEMYRQQSKPQRLAGWTVPQAISSEQCRFPACGFLPCGFQACRLPAGHLGLFTMSPVQDFQPWRLMDRRALCSCLAELEQLHVEPEQWVLDIFQLKGRNPNKVVLSDRLLVLADICHPLSVIRTSANSILVYHYLYSTLDVCFRHQWASNIPKHDHHVCMHIHWENRSPSHAYALESNSEVLDIVVCLNKHD